MHTKTQYLYTGLSSSLSISLLNPSNKGIFAALIAYGVWGLFPIYFKQIAIVAPLDVVFWRIAQCFLLLLVMFLFWRGPAKLMQILKGIDQWLLLFASALLLTTNWLIFVYAIKSNQILQSSLGYFLVPIVSVALGVVVFQEKPNRLKLIAVGIASVGMLLTFIVAGLLPWISLGLGVTFGIYGMLRKKARYDSATGLFLETSLLLPVAVVYLLYWAEPFSSFDAQTQRWMVLLGIITAVPLLTMIFAARRIELGTLGFFQYITPCMHLFLAVLVYQESIDLSRLIALISTLVAVGFWLAGSSPRFANAKPE